FTTLQNQGRYVEPVIRRVLRTSTDERVNTLCRRLLLTDFVTEIRSALHSASTGAKTIQNPLHVHAQLASVLREVGLNDEAEKEARTVLAGLSKTRAPAMTDHSARLYLRSYARAMEGLGDERGAMEWYGKFV